MGNTVTVNYRNGTEEVYHDVTDTEEELAVFILRQQIRRNQNRVIRIPWDRIESVVEQ